MEIKELRVGNLLDRNGIMEVLGIGANNKLIIYDHYNKERLPYGLDVDSFKAIELTPEWLERFGFKLKDPHSAVRILDLTGNGTTLQNWINTGKISICRSGINAKSCPCEYVHQLQNLYFSLTGEELAIDKTSLKN